MSEMISAIKTLSEALGAVDAAVARALQVIEGAPYWTFVAQPTSAHIKLKGNVARLYYFSAETEWELTTFVENSVEFPASLLFISDEELAAWKQEQDATYRANYRAKQEKIAKAHAKRRETEERELLAQLRAKYPD